MSVSLRSPVALAVALSLVSPVFVSQVLAADVAPGTTVTKDDDALPEIIVTAQFRNQNLQQTPIAITAVNAEMLEARNQTNIAQVAAQAPNVTLEANGAAFGSSMVAFIRGVGQTDFNLALEPGVGLYVDDVYFATLTGSLLDLLDLDRVEILRGPQGTLAGKNSIGGAIKLFSKRPTGDDTGYLELTRGSYNRTDGRGAADFTIIPDKLFARASFASRHHDGYVTRLDYACTHPGSNVPTHSVGDGCELGKDGSQAFNAGRLQVRWLASDAFEVNLAGDFTDDQSSVQANTLIKVNPASLGSAVYTAGADGINPVFFGSQFIPTNPYTSYATYTSSAASLIFGPNPYGPITVPPINHYKTWGLSGEIKWTFSESMNLTSITAYRDYDNQFAEQTDASPVGVQILLQKQSHHQFTQELRLNGSVASAVDYTLGAFYLNQNGGLNARVGLPWVGFDFIHGPDSTPAETWAGFFNATWHATDALTFDGGVRYSDETKDYTYYRHNADGSTINPGGYNGLVAGLNGTSAHFSGTRTDYRVAANYQFTPDMMGYVQTSTGYKGGGVNPRPFYPSQALSFGPEKLTAYEAGFKSNLFNRTVRVNIAAFYNNYEDIQLTLSSCPTPPLNGIQYPPAPCALPANVGSAHVKGAELEFEAHPFGGLEIDGSVSFLDFEYTKISGGTTSGVGLDMITPYTPENKASLGIQYEFGLGDYGSVTPRVDVTYQGSYFTAPINDPLWNEVDSRTTENARITWKDAKDVWNASLEVNNLSDKLYYTTLFDTHTSAGYVNGQPAMPRNWALTVKRNFN